MSSSSSSSDELEERLDEVFDEILEDTYNDIVEAQTNNLRRCTYVERNREADHNRLWNDYFSEDSTYSAQLYRRRFRMNKDLFMRIVHDLSENVLFFQHRQDATGSNSSACLLMVLRLTRLTSISDLVRAHHFCVYISSLMESSGYLEMSIYEDPHRRIYNDYSILERAAEATRKDVERAFGVLQSRFAIVRNPTLSMNKAKIGKIMRAYIILHNMIVENERDGYIRYDISEFEEGDVTRSSEVETERPTNLNNMFPNRNDLRDRHMHERLKNDLIENIWNKFGDEN
uniref:DDE Tnp4 domain-containing protein n=1 Tax=Brassica oleracea var. oleracea TaxID=109376 RepID=A0A0D3D021_BRAOL